MSAHTPGALDSGQWLEIREQWEDGTSYGELAKRYGISRGGISTRQRREGWKRGPNVFLEQRQDTPTEEVHRKVEEKLLNVSKAATPRERARAIESAADELTNIVTGHRRAWLKIQGILKTSIRAVEDMNWVPPGWMAEKDEDGNLVGGMQDSKGNQIPFDTKRRVGYAKDMAMLYRMLADGMITSQEGERRAHGIDFRITMKDRQEDEEASERRAFLNANITKLLRHVADRGMMPQDADDGMVIEGVAQEQA